MCGRERIAQAEHGDVGAVRDHVIAEPGFEQIGLLRGERCLRRSSSPARSSLRIVSPGTRITTGCVLRADVDQPSMSRNMRREVGARQVSPGMLPNIAMSKAPECVLSASERPAPKARSVTGVSLRASSCCNWSKVRWKNVAEVATTGLPPALAMPEAKATACSSVMPVST